MASYTSLRDALATALGSIEGLRVYAKAPGQVNVPAAVILPGDPVITWDSTLGRETDEFQLIIRLMVQKADDRSAQDTLDGYLAGSGDSSVKQAIEADPRLGGAVDWARASQVRRYGDYEHDGILYLGAEVVVDLSASGT